MYHVTVLCSSCRNTCCARFLVPRCPPSWSCKVCLALWDWRARFVWRRGPDSDGKTPQPNHQSPRSLFSRLNHPADRRLRMQDLCTENCLSDNISDTLVISFKGGGVRMKKRWAREPTSVFMSFSFVFRQPRDQKKRGIPESSLFSPLQPTKTLKPVNDENCGSHIKKSTLTLVKSGQNSN